MINYIQTPDGMNRPFKFGWKALNRLASELGVKKLSELATAVQELPLDKIPTFILFGFEAGAKAIEIPVDFSAETVGEWLDDDFTLFTKAFEAFGQQFGAGQTEELPKAEGPGKRKS